MEFGSGRLVEDGGMCVGGYRCAGWGILVGR